MAMENPPIYMIGGSKGGVGKSFVTLALVEYLRRTDVHTVLVETDTSNPDVMKAVHDEIECASCDLDEAGGWIDFVNFCDEHRDATVIVNTAARSQAGVARYGGTLASTLDDLARRLVVLWVINRQRDSLELLLEFGETFPRALTHVVRNCYFGTPDKFTLYRESNLRKAVEAQGRSLDFPDLADRVADELRSQRTSIRKASETMHIGQRAELFRWRALCDAMFSKVIGVDRTVHEH
ncbi:protein mobD [Paraburkholderia sp. BR10954]|uniref:nucleotide-binding protein n=1 Tax=Paraburkholderia sp. BR10954 TaxID=3236995 RepID=UPI0034D37C24